VAGADKDSSSPRSSDERLGAVFAGLLLLEERLLFECSRFQGLTGASAPF